MSFINYWNIQFCFFSEIPVTFEKHRKLCTRRTIGGRRDILPGIMFTTLWSYFFFIVIWDHIKKFILFLDTRNTDGTWTILKRFTQTTWDLGRASENRWHIIRNGQCIEISASHLQVQLIFKGPFILFFSFPKNL